MAHIKLVLPKGWNDAGLLCLGNIARLFIDDKEVSMLKLKLEADSSSDGPMLATISIPINQIELMDNREDRELLKDGGFEKIKHDIFMGTDGSINTLIKPIKDD